ncbi:MAG: TIGR00266 family protein [Anaerolineales bacterium]|nr:TIGR00266 family protein [Anaerolineales bacterium]
MSDAIDYQIFGNDLQLVEVELDPGEAVRGEIGTMNYMEEGIEMQTTTGGGVFRGLKRVFTGESFFIAAFLNNGQSRSRVAFAAPYPGKIVPLDLSQFGNQIYCQKDSFLCAAEGIEIEVALTKRIGAGIFGGEGFILQRLTGDGWAFAHAGGTVIEKDLAPGEKLRVDTGCLVAFDTKVDFDIQFIGGVRNALFGGEGLFLTTMTGPGKVYLQSLPFSRLVDRITVVGRLRRQVGEQEGIAGLGGDILKDVISGGS